LPANGHRVAPGPRGPRLGRGPEQRLEQRPKRCRRQCARFGAERGRLHAVGRRLPVGPRERRREALAAVLVVAENGAVRVAPGTGAERVGETRSGGVVEEREVDLVCVLVLDDAPRKGAGVEEAGVEEDLTRGSRLRGEAADVDRDLAGDEAPVERTGGEGVLDLLPLGRTAAVEHVVAARGERRVGERESTGGREQGRGRPHACPRSRWPPRGHTCQVSRYLSKVNGR